MIPVGLTLVNKIVKIKKLNVGGSRWPRPIFLHIGKSLPDPINLTSGVPKGGILSPIKFAV